VDDAHDLSVEHLMFIKELTDPGRLQYDHPPGLCLIAAGRGTTIPLKETLDQPDTTWLQFRRRLDKLEPFCRISNLLFPLPFLSLPERMNCLYGGLRQN